MVLKPTAAQMSPARISWISSRLFACMRIKRPTRSLRPLATLKIDSPAVILPEYTRKNASWPAYGSVMILKTSAENGSLSDGLRMTLVGMVYIDTLHRRDIQRRRQVIHHRV